MKSPHQAHSKPRRSRRSSLLIAITALSAVSALILSGCAGGSTQPADTSITVALTSEPGTLDPQLLDDINEKVVNGNIYESLLTRTPDGILAPQLAAELPEAVSDTTWRFKLRDGITFTNGEKLDAAAVVSSYERFLDDTRGNELLRYVPTITKVEAVDDLTVDITTANPDPILPARAVVVKIVPPKHSQDADFAETPVGTGPYQLVKWNRGVDVTVEANPDYWGDNTQVTKAVFRFIPDAGARLASVIAGEVDVAREMSADDIPSMPNSSTGPSLEHMLIILNAMEGVTSDVRVREALTIAIDRDTMAKSLFGGYSNPVWEPWDESILGFNKDLKPFKYDPDKATQLIEEAGATGQTISIVSPTDRYLKDRETIEAIGQYWEAIGLKVDIQFLEYNTWVQALFDRETRAPAIYVGHGNALVDPDGTLQTYYRMDGQGASNQDTDLAAMIDEQAKNVDEDSRRAQIEDIMDYAYHKYYVVPLFQNQKTYGLSKRIDWAPRLDDLFYLKDVSLVTE